MPNSGKRRSVRRSATRVVATIGPATETPVMIRRMIQAGVDVFRFNMSHGTHEEHASRIEAVREVAADMDVAVAVLVDLRGPKIRTGPTVTGEPVHLREGATVRVIGGKGKVDSERIYVDPKNLITQLEVGGRVLLDDGALELQITGAGASPTELKARVVRGGALKERAGVNVPEKRLDFPVPTKKDLEDLDLALLHRADFVALSFVQRAEDLRKLRRRIKKYVDATGRRDGGWASDQLLEERSPTGLREGPALIAKIERPAALEELDEILAVTDGLMVARGDLGVEVSLEKVPVWQKEILRRARAAGVFTITATQMLESMIHNSRPTRAEVSDVANAIYDGTDAVMLSAESAVGKYPVGSVRVLVDVALEVESSLSQVDAWDVEPEVTEWGDPIQAMARATVELAEVSRSRCIVVFTVSGRTGYRVSRYRPEVPIVCLTPSEATRRKLALAWNTESFVVERARTVDELLRRGVEMLKETKRVKKGDTVVLLGGAADLAEASNLLRWVRV